MKIRLLLDQTGQNPDFKPPDPRVDLISWMTYKHRVPADIVIPAGTEIENPWAWIHCLPNSEGIVIAEPIDDDAKLMVDGESKTLTPLAKRQFDHFRAQREAQLRSETVNKPVKKSKESDV